MTISLNTLMDNAIVELAQANERLRACDRALGQARSAQCQAINRVNEAQRAFDKLVDSIRKESGNETDWKRQPGLPVP